jgi:DNA-binding NtrC family response regulator
VSEKRIFVVDDEKQIREMYSLAFTKPASLSDLLEAAEHAFKKLARWKKRNPI